MNRARTSQIIWFAALLLLFAAGCGGSDETAPAPETEGPGPTSPQVPSGLPPAGEDQAVTEPELHPRVEFETTAGTFTVKLYRDKAPKTVENFLDYVNVGFYDGTIFHEVMPGYAVVGGGYTEEPDGTLLEKATAGTTIRNEADTALSNKRGTIAMARAEQDADSAKCQFFFNLRDNVELDYSPPQKEGIDLWKTAGYCAFGEVEGNGLQILEDVANQPVTTRDGMSRVPRDPVTIVSVRKLPPS